MKYFYLITLTTFAYSSICGESLKGVYISQLINRTGKEVRLYKRARPSNDDVPPVEVTVGSPIRIPEEHSEQLLFKVSEKWFNLYIKDKYGTEKVILRPMRIERIVREMACSSILQRTSGNIVTGTLYLYANLLETPLPTNQDVALFFQTPSPLY